MQASRDGGPALVEGEPFFVRVDLGVRVGGRHLPEGMQELTAKIANAGKALAELLVQGDPGDELRFAGRDAVQALGEPNIGIERHGR